MAWAQIRGHGPIVESFARAFQRGRLAHGYFFVGPDGVGKRRFAIELAKTILCEQRPANVFEACDHCPACLQVTAQTHPDYFTLAKPADKANIPIDSLREFCRKLSLKPVRGHGKIAIVDDADALDDPISQHASANAFLKTLEEPPPGSLLILIGTSAEQQRPTILSRCQIVRFQPLNEDDVVAILREAGADDEASARCAARQSGGSPGLALAFADPGVSAFRSELVRALAGKSFDGAALGEAWMKYVEGAGKELSLQRPRAMLAVRLLIDLLTDALARQLGGSPLRSRPEDLPALDAVSRIGTERLLGMLERCLEADRQIDRRVQLVLVVEALLDAIGQMIRATSFQEGRRHEMCPPA